MSARLVAQHGRGAGGSRQVFVAPGHDRERDGVEVEAFGGEAVFEPGGFHAVLVALEQPGGDQRFQAGGEDGAGDAEVALHLPEAPHAEERLA